MRSSWNVTSPSQSTPSQRSDSWICSVAVSTSRLVSVFSIRSRNSPPSWRAKSQLKSAVWTPPMWRKPVGLGAKRTIGGMRRIVGVVFIGAHVSSAGGIHTAIDRGEEMGADSVQVFTQSPRMWRPTNHPPENFERFKERRAEAGIQGVLCHALYLINLANPKDDFYDKSVVALSNTVDVGSAIEADGVVFHVGSHLGAGMDVGLKRVVKAMKKVLDRCSETTWLLMENCAGTGATIGRSIEELAVIFDRLGGHPRLGVCLDSCHLYASGYDVTDEAALDGMLDALDDSIGLDRLRALHVNDSAVPFASNRDRHANIGDGLMGKKLSVFLQHPKLQGLPAVLEVPGEDGHGPTAGLPPFSAYPGNAHVSVTGPCRLRVSSSRGAVSAAGRTSRFPRAPSTGPLSRTERLCARTDLREDPEARLAERELVELRVDAPEVVFP